MQPGRPALCAAPPGLAPARLSTPSHILSSLLLQVRGIRGQVYGLEVTALITAVSVNLKTRLTRPIVEEVILATKRSACLRLKQHSEPWGRKVFEHANADQHNARSSAKYLLETGDGWQT